MVPGGVSVWTREQIVRLPPEEYRAMSALIDEVGVRSARAQGLPAPITSTVRTHPQSHCKKNGTRRMIHHRSPHPSHRVHRIACSRTSGCTSRAPTPPARTTARPSYSASSRLVPSGSSSPKPPAEASRRWNRAACWTFTCTKPRSAADGARFCSTRFLKAKVGTPRGWRTTGRPRSSSRSWPNTTTLGRTLGKITTLSCSTSTGPLRLPTLALYARGTGDGR